MPQWEYTTLYLGQLPRRTLETDLLNALGRDGWELVCILGNGLAYLKRPQLSKPANRTKSTVVRPGTPVPATK